MTEELFDVAVNFATQVWHNLHKNGENFCSYFLKEKINLSIQSDASTCISMHADNFNNLALINSNLNLCCRSDSHQSSCISIPCNFSLFRRRLPIKVIRT